MIKTIRLKVKKIIKKLENVLIVILNRFTGQIIYKEKMRHNIMNIVLKILMI